VRRTVSTNNTNQNMNTVVVVVKLVLVAGGDCVIGGDLCCNMVEDEECVSIPHQR